MSAEIELPPLDTTLEERSYAGDHLRKPLRANLAQQLQIYKSWLSSTWGNLLCRERQLLAVLAELARKDEQLPEARELIASARKAVAYRSDPGGKVRKDLEAYLRHNPEVK